MALTSFRVGPQKALVLAEALHVPKLMIVAGPNGVGKSTFLFALKQRRGTVNMTGRFLYLAPHRVWRRQTVQRTHLFDAFPTLLDVLAGDQVQGSAHMRILDGSRTPESADEAWNTIKHSLSRVEARFNDRAVSMLRAKGSVSLQDLGDVYKPLRDLTKYLLPHLVFDRVDLENHGNIRCLFKRTDNASSLDIDIDDLSSGERSVISMFLPFIESEIDAGLKALEASVANAPPPVPDDRVVLIDEPELHLHPLLQARLVEYVRDLTERAPIQFILVTHSPTIVAAATYDELFVLSPPTNPPVNQLVQLADSAERLRLMRDLSGDTHVLTSCRGLVCVEGEAPGENGRAVADKRILELLCPELKNLVLLPFGGKGNALLAARRLRELMGPLPVVSVTALVDADVDVAPDPEPWVAKLPVAMVENLLLVPAAIWSLLEPHREQVGLSDSAHVDRVLREIARARRDDEIRLRLRTAFRIEQPGLASAVADAISAELVAHAEAQRAKFADLSLVRQRVKAAEDEVDALLKAGEELRRFHGKRILQAFYELHGKRAGIGYDALLLQLARMIGESATWSVPIREHLKEIIPKRPTTPKEPS